MTRKRLMVSVGLVVALSGSLYAGGEVASAASKRSAPVACASAPVSDVSAPVKVERGKRDVRHHGKTAGKPGKPAKPGKAAKPCAPKKHSSR